MWLSCASSEISNGTAIRDSLADPALFAEAKNQSRRERMKVARQFIAWNVVERVSRPVGTV